MPRLADDPNFLRTMRRLVRPIEKGSLTSVGIIMGGGPGVTVDQDSARRIIARADAVLKRTKRGGRA